MHEIDANDLVMTEDYEYLHQGQPFTGVAVATLNGHRLTEEHFEDGCKHGVSRRWFEDSDQLQSERWYRENTMHGISRDWYESGQLKSESHDEHGITVKRTTWNQFGEVVEEYVLSSDDALHEILQMRRKRDQT